MHEFDWITRYFAPLTGGRSEALGLKDDAGVLTVPDGKQLVVTTDTINESIHFLPGTSPQHIAHKALATNLSDLAAMGATPLAYTLNLSLPGDVDEAWLQAFTNALAALQKEYSIFLLGGDTTRSQSGVSISITAFGLVDTPLTRSGAKVGDAVYVTGSVGDAVCGLHALQHNHQADTLLARHLAPTPRVSVGLALHGVATACLDVSDGLVQDADHIASTSQVGLRIHASQVPLSQAAQDYSAQHSLALTDLLTGGDDYELLFTAPVAAQPTLEDIAKQTGVPITRIGEVVAGSGVTLLDENGKPIALDKAGWQHF